MQIFRKVAFRPFFNQWFSVYFNTDGETWDYVPIGSGEVSEKLNQLVTDFPDHSFGWQNDWQMGPMGLEYVFDRAAVPN